MRLDDPRDRTIDHFDRERFKREVRRGFSPALVVIASLVVAAVGATTILGKIAPTTIRSSYEMKVAVEDATAVSPNVNRVRFKGIPVGTITAVEHEGEQAVLRIRTEKKFGPIYRDARAALRPNTALNDMYLDIVDRGTTSAGRLEGDTPLPPSQTSTPVSVSEVLNTFTPSVRLRLRTLLDELGNGLDDRGRSLQAVFVQLAPLVRNAGTIADQLAAREPLVRRLVANTTALTREIGAREEQLRRLVTDGASTVTALQASSGDLDRTLAALPTAVSALQTSFGRVRGTLDDVDGAVRALGPVADGLPEALRALRRLAVTADPAVEALREPVTRLVPLARALRPLSSNAQAAVAAFAPQADTVDKVSGELVACKRGFQNFFQWNASMAKFGDSRGPIPRGNVVVGAQSSGVFGDPNEIAPPACSGGRAIGGRPAREEDKR